MRLIDADALKRKSQKVATEAWKLRIKATVEVILNQFIDYIDAAPTIKPEPQWIPVTERLPIEARHYLCSFNRPNRIDKIYVDLAYWTGGRWYGYGADQINAWMPLPKPYKEGQDG